jgi:hypothetical protein
VRREQTYWKPGETTVRVAPSWTTACTKVRWSQSRQAIVKMIRRKCWPRPHWGRWGRGRDRGRAPIGFESGRALHSSVVAVIILWCRASAAPFAHPLSPRWYWIDQCPHFASGFGYKMVAARDTPVTGNLLRRGCWGRSRAREAGSSSLPSHRTRGVIATFRVIS